MKTYQIQYKMKVSDKDFDPCRTLWTAHIEAESPQKASQVLEEMFHMLTVEIVGEPIEEKEEAVA